MIDALLRSKTVVVAARKADVSLRTAHRWRADPDFQTAFNEERGRLQQNIVNRLICDGLDFESVLHKVAMDDKVPPATRASAAAKGLEALSRFADGDRERRLVAIEEALIQLKGRRSQRRHL